MASEKTETAEEKAKRLKKGKGLKYLSDSEGIGRFTGGLPNIIVTGIISLLAAVLIVFLVAPTKADLEQFKFGLANEFDSLSGELKTDVSDMSTSLDTKFSTYRDEVGTRLVNTESKVGALESLMGGFDQRISNLAGLETKVESALTEVDTKLDGLDDEIGELVEETIEGELEDYAKLSDLDNSGYRSDDIPYAVIVGLRTDRWVQIETSAPEGFVLLVEFHGTKFTATEEQWDFDLDDKDYREAGFAPISPELVLLFVDHRGDEWDNGVTVYWSLPTGDWEVLFIAARFVADNDDRAW